MNYEDLTLGMIDAQRHLTTSIDIVKAVAYAARGGCDDVRAYRFVTALVMTGLLHNTNWWPEVLGQVMHLETSRAK